MSDSNQVQFYWIEETAWGQTPETGAKQEFLPTGESLNYDKSTVESNRIRSDRQTTELIDVGAQAGGGVNMELEYGQWDSILKAALMDTWSADLGVSVENQIAASAGGACFTSTAATNFAGISAGQWIKVGGFTANTNANNGYYQVTAVAATQITVSPAPAVVEAAATGKNIILSGSMLRNGTTQYSFSIEKKFTDLSPVAYHTFKGMMVNNFNLSLQSEQVVTGSFDFIGKGCTMSTSGPASSGSLAASPGNTPVNAAGNVGHLWENGAAVAECLVQGIDLSLTNNLRPKTAIGTMGLCGVGIGKLQVTGNVNAYFNNANLYVKYLNGTETSLSFRLTDPDGNTYIFTIPRIQFESDQNNVGGSDQDVMDNIGWRALRHADYDCMIQVDRFSAA